MKFPHQRGIFFQCQIIQNQRQAHCIESIIETLYLLYNHVNYAYPQVDIVPKVPKGVAGGKMTRL